MTTCPPDSKSEQQEALIERVRAEVLLHLAKNKGFVHIASAPHSPRIEQYFARLRKQLGGRLNTASFLGKLGLEGLLCRSREPDCS